MSWSIAQLWDTPEAKTIASQIAGISGLYCGPAAVGWIAAVWNRSKGRNYDYRSRLSNKSLFPDGPRDFERNFPGFQTNLSDLLKRETEGELRLSRNTFRRYGTIHDLLERNDMPIVIRMALGVTNITSGLHYVSLYKSEKQVRSLARDLIRFYWQDNGLYGRRDGNNSGLYATDWRSIGALGMFYWGAKQVVKC